MVRRRRLGQDHDPAEAGFGATGGPGAVPAPVHDRRPKVGAAVVDRLEAGAQSHERVLHDVLGRSVVVGQQPRQSHRAGVRLPVEVRELVPHPTRDHRSRADTTSFHTP